MLGFVLCAFGVLACAAGSGHGSEAASGGAGVALGEEFTLRVAETAQVAETGLRVGYVELVDDSRCPPEVTCVWEGDAVVRVSLSATGGIEPKRVELHTYTGQTQHVTYAGYRVALVDVARDASTATFVVTG